MLDIKVAERKKVMLAMMDRGESLDIPQRKWPLGGIGRDRVSTRTQLGQFPINSPCTT